MSGKPAARIDDKVKYARIVTGSRTVLIGSQGGVACSVCPGGEAVGNPVNPQLGAKVLSDASDLDFALPGAMPLVWQRQYSSYVNAQHGGHCGVLGYGWGLPTDLRIKVEASATLLHDSQGRTITFDALAAGESIYSPSEDIWLLRSGWHPGNLTHDLAVMTGPAKFTEAGAADSFEAPPPRSQQAPLWWQGRFSWIRRDMACGDLMILAANGSGDTVWVFGPANWQAIEAARKAIHEQKTAGKPVTVTEPEIDANWILLGKVDRLGRSQRYHWTQVLGQERITTIDDGVGRGYQLHYTQALAAQDAQHFHHRSTDTDDHEDEHFFWQADSGVRLSKVDLYRDPLAPMLQTKPTTLVQYSYSDQGDLTSVTNRHGQVVRRFAWRNHLMIAHQERGGPEHHYAYDRYEPGGQAIEQRNQEGLDYKFDYQELPEIDGQPRRVCVVTDSLGRIDKYIFQGEAGLARLVEHTRADGSTIKRKYNQYGHLTEVTDPLGRSVYMAVSPMGQLLATQGPDGTRSSQRFDDATNLLQSSTDAAGRTTHHKYDYHHRMTAVTLPDGSSEQYHYPNITLNPGDLGLRANADKPIRITDANGRDKHISYTPTGQTASYTDCSGQSTHYEYNRWGQTTAVRNALGERVAYEYNEQDQLRTVHYPDGSKEHYTYDARGQVVEVKAGRRDDRDSKTPASTTAASVRMAYDLWGRLVQRSHAGQHLGFAYDAAGRLTQLTNENGEHTRFAWDVMDRLAQETGFDARVQSYQYDAAGQLVQSSDGWAAEQGLPAHTSHYEWTVTGQLAARHLPATDLLPASTQRYEWGKVGELLQASVWHPTETGSEGPSQRPAPEGILLSQALIERDAAGRVIGEVQRLYKIPAQDELQDRFFTPEIEFEHRISHQLDALGHRQGSQLQGLGNVGYLLYGAGHVHDITWQGESLVNFERDALHREVHRQVLTDINHTTPGENTAKPLYRKLSWDAAGRMETMQWMGLEQGSALDDMLASPGGQAPNRVPPTLLGAMTARQYYYDSLGQMVGMRSHAGISRFAYDASGRLTGAHTPHAGSQRWQFDPAGNRLPIAGPETPPTATDAITGHLNETDRLRAQQRAAAQANPITKEQLLRSDFNPLQADPDPSSNQPLHTSKRWAGNRVAYYENQEDASSQAAKIHYQYDSRGNRTQSLDEATGRKLELAYDSGNQLVQVVVEEAGQRHTQSYRYDAFGRRLAKYNAPSNAGSSEEKETDYFGWDGDRLIHTERFHSGNAKDDDGAAQPEVIHTIYEPGSFTPLIQLRRASKAEPDLGDALLANTSPGVVQDALRKALADIKEFSATLPQNIAFKSMSKDVQIFMREQLQEYEQTLSDQRKAAAEKVEIRHYLCDHLGTPNALIREDSRLDWAVQLDAWGNVRAAHNPGDLYQPIRLPGQHADGETGLYYNRHRYYESGLGRYVNPDPIGILGGVNLFSYVGNASNIYADPLGLVRWSEVVNNGLGILGNTGGAVVGAALLAAPEPTTLTKIAGGAVLSKSIYGLGTSWYGFTRAFSDDSGYDISPDKATLSRTLVCVAGCNDAGRGVADALDLGLDLVAGKVPVNNKIKLPITWGKDVDPPWKQPVSSMFTNSQTTH
ncbi:RHS repeat-associated core domain-containing protein [Comamonas sp.]|uniref:RHS repeat-associated core domain-containing protein n=1 Tax=Comamonas sp. TaxID=34028 RepID=UPI0028A0ACF0|nr:RHS repeat-associated core domain-containing protein [Comamonas sp.]